MRLAIPTLLALALVFTPGCKSDAEKQMSDMTAKQKEIVSILKTVTDAESAKAANEKIKAVAKDIEGILHSAKDTKTTEAERKQLADKYKPQHQEIAKQAQAELRRIGQIPEASLALTEGLVQLRTAGLRAGAPAPQ